MAAVVSLCSVSGVTGMAEGNKGQVLTIKELIYAVLEHVYEIDAI